MGRTVDELLETMPAEEIAERIALSNLREDPRINGTKGPKAPKGNSGKR